MANLVAEYLADILDCQEIVAFAATADASACKIALWDGTGWETWQSFHSDTHNRFIGGSYGHPTRLFSGVELLDDTPSVLRPREEIVPVDKIVREFWRITQSQGTLGFFLWLRIKT